jgi:polyferredoxin
MNRHLLLLFLLLILAASFFGCFPGGGHATPEAPAGFFTGIWHGWIAPLSLLVALFKDGVRIYEVNNTGWWYDLGYYMAVIAGFGSISLLRKKEKRSKQG